MDFGALPEDKTEQQKTFEVSGELEVRTTSEVSLAGSCPSASIGHPVWPSFGFPLTTAGMTMAYYSTSPAFL